MKNKVFIYTVIFILLLSIPTSCLVQREKDGFVIASAGTTARLVIDENENQVVYTAANLFADDVSRVTNYRPVINTGTKSGYQIKAGTMGTSPGFDEECKKAGIDTDELKSQWEAYVLKVVPGSNSQTLLIAGSDPRGTAFGFMEFSRLIGVSPWYWWADVSPVKQESISLPDSLFLENAPRVKYRGIFLNDEDWGLQPWAAKTFEPETGDIGPKTYEKIFELLLRLKANTIWPAMHNCTRAFFTYPGNIKMADKYGIWVGSSHCEPMLRNNVDEWHRWNPSSGERGEWNFDENPEQIKEYWKQRVVTTADYDGIYTVGMRGIHDGSMPGGRNLNDKVEILGHVLDAQRNMLTEMTGEEITSIPQIFCPYKEVLELYKAGAEIPEDVTIMWADDNHGYIRQLSNDRERKRTGGAGVYYHISYWGRPHDFLWLESIPVSLIWEEMDKAYQTNAKNVWIVNVGDIKPNEIGMNFFLEMAWNPDQFSPETLDAYYTRFAESQFGSQYAEEIGELLRKYFQLGFSRKPEHMGWNSVYPNAPIRDPDYLLFDNGDEVQQRIDAYETLEDQAEKLYEKMPAYLKDAFYQLVGYKVIGASNMNKKILYAYKSRIYAHQGRVIANQYARKAEDAFEKIREATIYYNDLMAGGKWKYMMTCNPRGLPVFDMPETGSYHPAQQAAGGIIPEGCRVVTDTGEGTLTLPVFNSVTDRSYFIDVFNSGAQPLKWEAEAADGWIKTSKTSGETETQERIWVSIDWSSVPSNDTVHSTLRIKLNGQNHAVLIKAFKPGRSIVEKNMFIEDNGVVSMNAESFSGVQNTPEGRWQTIQGLGRMSDAIGSFPVTAKPIHSGELSKAPELSYNFYTFSDGEVKLQFHCLPGQPVNDDYQLRFAVVIDDGEPAVINAALKQEMDEHNEEWQKNVLSAVTVKESGATIRGTGKHNLKIRMIDPGVVLDKIEIVLSEKTGNIHAASTH